MAHLYLAMAPPSGATPTTATIYIRVDGSTAANSQTLQSQLSLESVTAVDRYPQMLKFRNRLYIIGSHSRAIMRDEFGGTRAVGVRSPKTVPTLADAGLAASSTGNMIGYQTFGVKSSGKIVQRSNPGPASATLAAAGTGRLWGNLDITPDDYHANIAEGWVSVDGSIPAKAWELALPLASASHSENVTTAGLGETLPVRVSLTGATILAPNARGVPPYCRFAEEYHNSIFYAGDPSHPERIYPSKLYEPESVDSTPITIGGRTEIPWLETTDGGAVTGIKRQGDELVVGTLRGIDVIQGLASGDYTIRRVSNYWGVVSHWSMRRCGPQSALYFAAPQGITTYLSGAFSYVSPKIETWWRDQYKANPELFENAYGGEDRFRRCYRLLLPEANDTGTRYINIDYVSAMLGDSVIWYDRRDRIDKVIGELLIDGSNNYFDTYTGSCDGYVRKDNIAGDADDDGDTYLKKLTVQFPHRFFGDQAGDDHHGAATRAIEMFCKHPNNAVTASVYGGDDDAPNATTPQWARSLPATGPGTGREKVKRTSQREVTPGVTGKGVTLKLEVQSPLGVEVRGWGCELTPGPQGRSWK